MNSKETKSDESCTQSCEDVNCCNNTTPEDSPEPQSAQPETEASDDAREEPPIRVRDMINLYNFATQKNQELAHAKSIYFGANRSATSMDLNDLELAQQQQQQAEQECCDGTCLKIPGMEGTGMGRAGGSSSQIHSKKPGNFRVTTANDQTSLRQSPQTDAQSGASVEKSYQSKTTIRRTEQGVRIIIDIFFDKNESDIDIVGSRVETDIPESRILADFQQHSLATRSSQQVKQQPNV
ncbi:PREDICTED: uncharacterized protein LOC108615935 [Drosophila arizonae]|uniref:Uncharacterized protein LOC108615935 n=1 Tax=Drosophila arizonae TaxID=7263 RepID=A0ABM1PGG1_DROAR|nr:PREDICTED: uncharacterized protein LOC108615935 [Drosophila arizonae]